jgi:hypothetical protein
MDSLKNSDLKWHGRRYIFSVLRNSLRFCGSRLLLQSGSHGLKRF